MVDTLLTVDQAAQWLRCSPTTIRRLCREGHLPAIRVRSEWRIPSSRLAEALVAA